MKITVLLFLTGLAFPRAFADSCCSPSPAPAATWTSESLFHIEAAFQTQTETKVRLSDLKGAPTLVAMFYASCPTVCPRLMGELKGIEARLPEEQRGRLRVVLITFDPERDTPEALTTFAENWNMDTARWQLWSGDPVGIRTVAASLGVRYRTTPNGEISHSAPIVLLNAKGEIDQRLDAPGGEKQKAFEARLLEVLLAS